MLWLSDFQKHHKPCVLSEVLWGSSKCKMAKCKAGLSRWRVSSPLRPCLSSPQPLKAGWGAQLNAGLLQSPICWTHMAPKGHTPRDHHPSSVSQPEFSPWKQRDYLPFHVHLEIPYLCISKCTSILFFTLFGEQICIYDCVHFPIYPLKSQRPKAILY